MRLLSATVRNYRIHRETTVEFPELLTLVGGENESGKSTLVEAIHRALFLRANVTGQAQKTMLSEFHTGGHPEVELEFLAEGRKFRLSKIFSGNNGRTTLAEEGGTTLHGDEAGSRLAELLRVEEAGGGRGGVNQAHAQWGHLWVWQGQGGHDPSEHAAAEGDSLLSKLKDRGGGAAMQSELDGRVVERIGREFDRYFTKSGRIKVDSDLARADEALEGARLQLSDAKARFEKLEHALQDFAAADSVIQSGNKAQLEHTTLLRETREKLKQVADLKHREELALRSRDDTAKQAERFDDALEEIQTLRKKVVCLSEAAAPDSEALETLETELAQKRDAFRDSEQQSEEIAARLTAERQRSEVAGVLVRLREAEKDLRHLEQRQTEIAALQAQREELNNDLARISPVGEKDFLELQKLDNDLNQAEAVLRAISTDLEVVEGGPDVRLDGNPVRKGETHSIGQATLLTVGDGLVLKITPGGGTALDQARRAAAALRSEKQDRYGKIGVSTLKEAGEIRGRRQALESRLRELDAELSGKDAERLREQLEEVNRTFTAASAELERRAAFLPDFPLPASLEEARRLHGESVGALEPLEKDLAAAEAKRRASSAAVADLEAKREKSRQSTREAEIQLVELSARLQTRLTDLGDPDTYTARKKELHTAHETAARALAEIQESLATLQPAILEADESRYERVLARTKEEMDRAGQQRAVARSHLASDGSADPAAAVETAAARLDSALARHHSLDQHAEAIRLLRDRFAAEQQKLSDRFSQPLAEEVTRYLQQIFGPGAKASVTINEGIIEGFRMSRDGTAFDFDRLSGGTREQVAAAVRLAMAHILAADHDGVLPLVFDDAFTNSDPERARSLQRMLDLAARDGLQVILLTCDPAAYSGLGASSTNLSAR